MSDKTAPASPVTIEIPLSESGSTHAPFLYFEDATAFSHLNGIIRITLETCRLLNKSPNVVYIDRVVVAHLRMNLPAARSLKTAIEGALLLADPPPTEAKN